MPLLADGLDVDGTDVSADMIEQARDAAAAAGVATVERLAVQAFDQLEMPRRYRTIFSIGSFAIGGSRERDQEALRRVHHHLHPGGAVLLSYEVISDEDHALLAAPERAYPRPWPDTGMKAILADGDELELRTRAVAYDPATRTHSLEIRALLWRGGSLVNQETGSLSNTCYRPDDVLDMLQVPGFSGFEVEGPYTGRAPDPGDEAVVIVARRVE